MELYELPEGWEWTSLGEVCSKPQYGYTTKASQKKSGPKFLRITDLKEEGVNWDTVPYCTEPPKNQADYLLHDDDLVVARAGSVGKSYRVTNPPDAIFASYLIRFRPIKALSSYLAYFLQSPHYWRQIEDTSTGTTMFNVNATKLAALNVPIAPPDEQPRIVSKIESLFQQSRAARTALTRVPVLMAQFRRAVLASAFRGELVEPDPNDEPATSLLERIREVRKQSISKKNIEPVDTSDLPELPEGWIWVRFEELLAELKNGHFSKAPAFEPPGIPILRISAVRPLSVKLDEPRFFRGELEDVSQYELRNGDLLFTRYNGSLNLVGVCGLVRSLNEVMIYPDKLIRARFFENTVSPAYLEAYFSTALPRSIIEDKTKSSAGQQGISGKDLKDVPVPLPPLGEQQRIVAKIEALFAQADIIEQAAFVSLRRAEQVDQSILARAFRGELR